MVPGLYLDPRDHFPGGLKVSSPRSKNINKETLYARSTVVWFFLKIIALSKETILIDLTIIFKNTPIIITGIPLRIDHETLRNMVREIFVKAGFRSEDASIIADHLVTANLRGVDSHGVVRVRYYLDTIEKGFIKPCGDLSILRDSGVFIKADGNSCLGIPIAYKATMLVIERAREYGVGVLGCGNLGHVGMLAYYTSMIAREGFIGFAATNANPMVVPWGGAKPVFGTNPFSISFPTRSEPIVIDMATSAIAHFKAIVASRKGEILPEGVAIDEKGEITRDPNSLYALLPFGGYKGYAISLAVEILAGILGGGILSVEVPAGSMRQGGFIVAALDPSRLIDREEYLSKIEMLIKTIKNTQPAKGYSEVLIPGEPEERKYRERVREGIELDEETWREISQFYARAHT